MKQIHVEEAYWGRPSKFKKKLKKKGRSLRQQNVQEITPKQKQQFDVILQWTGGGSSLDLPHARKVANSGPFEPSGSEIATQPLYRVFFVPDIDAVPAKGLNIKAIKPVQSWAPTRRGCMNFLGNGFSKYSSKGGIIVLLKHKFDPDDVLVYVPAWIKSLPERERRSLISAGVQRQDEVLIKAKDIHFAPKDIELLRVSKAHINIPVVLESDNVPDWKRQFKTIGVELKAVRGPNGSLGLQSVAPLNAVQIQGLMASLNRDKFKGKKKDGYTIRWRDSISFKAADTAIGVVVYDDGRLLISTFPKRAKV